MNYKVISIQELALVHPEISDLSSIEVTSESLTSAVNRLSILQYEYGFLFDRVMFTPVGIFIQLKAQV